MADIDFSKADERQLSVFTDILAGHRATHCTQCSKPIEISGCFASNGCTEWGTGCCVVSVACASCGHTVVLLNSWYPGVDDIDEYLNVLDREWRAQRS